METIHKYTLEIADTQEIVLPYNAQIISVCEQRNRVVLYVLVDTDKELRQICHTVRIVGTGQPLEKYFIKTHRFIGTVLVDAGDFVWHVFEETP